MVGDAMANAGDIQTARLDYGRVTPGSPNYVSARGRLIQTYDLPANAAIVLKLAQETVQAAPNDDEALAQLADALRASERYDESAKAMDTLLGHLGDKASWEAYYMRGIALDRSGRWPEAERDFRKALSLKPDESEVLNYLGYSWIDRGEKLPEAKAMVEKAVAAKPDSGAMVDSLGWAYYRLGQYGSAVEQLERAAELEPADPDINNHLGDAYWQAGRRVEAKFQWELVLTLEPDAKLKAEAEAKLKYGLTSDGKPALPPAAVASR
jgi:Flp pilus assembly protein TadD